MKRSKWKGVFIKSEKLKKDKTSTQAKMCRNSYILPKLFEETFLVHNGRNFKNVTVSKEMLGHKFGEFARTREIFEYKKKKKKKKK